METRGRMVGMLFLAGAVLAGCSDRRQDNPPPDGGTNAVPAVSPRRIVQPPRKKQQSPMKAVAAWATRHAADFNERLNYRSNKGDIEGLLRMSRSAQNSGDREKRMAMVQALGWNAEDERAATELLAYASDADEEVAKVAFDFVRNSLGNIEESPTKAKLVSSLARICSDDADRREVISQFETMDASLAVGELADLCEAPSPGLVEAAREEYKFLTGERFTTSLNARYLATRLMKREQHVRRVEEGAGAEEAP